jgi:hypothetical protein
LYRAVLVLVAVYQIYSVYMCRDCFHSSCSFCAIMRISIRLYFGLNSVAANFVCCYLNLRFRKCLVVCSSAGFRGLSVRALVEIRGLYLYAFCCVDFLSQWDVFQVGSIASDSWEYGMLGCNSLFSIYTQYNLCRIEILMRRPSGGDRKSI